MGLRIGHGYDVHKFASDRKLILCGIEIPSELGLLGHSDADVATHALMDALLGALRQGDIGQLFPDTDPAFEGISSLLLLKRVMQVIHNHHARCIDADITIAAQAPKLAPYRCQMRDTLAQTMGVPTESIGVKATTTEGLGFVGRKEGIAAWAVALLEQE